jgi:hypothetical protein
MNKAHMTYEDRMERMSEHSDETPTARELRWMRNRAWLESRREDREERDYERMMRG